MTNQMDESLYLAANHMIINDQRHYMNVNIIPRHIYISYDVDYQNKQNNYFSAM